MNKWYPVILLFLLLLLGRLPAARSQCPAARPTTQENFKFYDPATKKEISSKFLCVGRPVRIVDASTPRHDPKLLFYNEAAAGGTCTFQDTSVFFTPKAAGPLVVSINIQNLSPQPGTSSGIIVAYPFEVKESPKPLFTTPIACGTDSVELTITDQSYDRYLVQVGAGKAVVGVRNVPKKYAIAGGAGTVTVTGEYVLAGLCSNSDTRSFTPLPPPQTPQIQQLAVQAGSLQFSYPQLQAQYQYSLQLQDGGTAGGFRTVASIPTGSTSFTFSATSLPGCYRILLSDACHPAITYRTSGALCTVQMTTSSANGRNLLRWTTGTPAAGYSVLRNGQVLARLGGSDTQYEDVTGICGSTYTYRIAAIMGTGTSLSNEAAIATSVGAPPPAPVLSASFNLKNQVELIATPAAGARGGLVTYLRNGTTELATTPVRFLRDSTAGPPTFASPACYSARFTDECGSRSPESGAVCPVVLEAKAADPNGNSAMLVWSAFRGPDPRAPVSYRVLTLASNGTVLSSQPVRGLTFADLQPPADQQVLRYRIEATVGGFPTPSYSNIAAVARRPTLAVPTAFTPNGDGLNDVLEVKGRFLSAFTFIVIDRNGQEVFRGTNRGQTWDGRIGGQPPVVGTYVWRFEAVDETGQRITQNGTVNILR